MSINWAKLYSEGRCKAIGIAWTEAEKEALYILNVPVEFVRRGCLTLKDWKAAEADQKGEEARTGKVQLKTLKRDQLMALCAKHGIEVTDAAVRPILIEALENAGVPKSIPAEEVPRTQEG